MDMSKLACITEGDFRRMKAAMQQEVFDAAQDYLPNFMGSNLNARRRWEMVKAAKAAYWDQQPETRKIQQASKPTVPITAAECNEWLRTLPWPPLAGFEQRGA